AFRACFFSSRRRHTRFSRDWSSDVCSSDLAIGAIFRQSVSARLGPGESAVPFTALALEEADGRPFVSDWLVEYGIDGWVARLVRSEERRVGEGATRTAAAERGRRGHSRGEP